MPFIKFTEAGRSHAAKASLNKVGMISLSDGARRRFGLDDYSFCVLYYDKDARSIGIELCKDGDAEGAMTIRFRKTGADIAAKSFVEFFDIGITDTTTFPIEKDESTGMLVIDLSKPKPKKISKRTREEG